MQLLRLANEDQTVIIDLLGGPIYLRDGWDDQTPPMGGAYTYEPYGAQFDFSNYQPVGMSYDLGIKGRPSIVLSEMERLQDFLESIRLFHSGVLAAKSCWLEWQADCDENPKRSLLYSGAFKVTSQDDVTPTATKSVIIGRLTLTRHPLWETPTTTNVLEENLSGYGGKYDYINVPGNVPARLLQASLNTSGPTTLYRFWFGIRRFNQGVANFEPVWECEDGTNGTDAADVVDATASAGDKVTVTYVTLTLVNRLTITVLQTCAAAGHTDYNHQQGRYLVLLRCKVSAAGTSGIQMRNGYTGNILSEEVYIDNTNWRLIPIGNISIPPWEGNLFNANRYYQNFRIDIYAEQLTAGHNLDLDCLVLIPNEHLTTIEGANVAAGGLTDYVYTMENDQDISFAYEPAAIAVYDSLESATTDFYLPQGNGTIIVAGENVAQHDLTGTISFSMDYYPRWLLYRTD